MGCDIHAFAEVQANGRWVATLEGPWRLFSERNYAKFGFLAGVRDHSVPTLAAPRGLPDELSDSVRLAEQGYHGDGGHNYSWLMLSELLAFNYNILVEDDEGKKVPLCELLGNQFFQHLRELQTITRGPVRIVFWFDN